MGAEQPKEATTGISFGPNLVYQLTGRRAPPKEAPKDFSQQSFEISGHFVHQLLQSAHDSGRVKGQKEAEERHTLDAYYEKSEFRIENAYNELSDSFCIKAPTKTARCEAFENDLQVCLQSKSLVQCRDYVTLLQDCTTST